MKMTTGVIYLKIRCELAQDVDIRDAKKFVKDLDYNIKSQTPEVTVDNTDIIDWGIWPDCITRE